MKKPRLKERARSEVEGEEKKEEKEGKKEDETMEKGRSVGTSHGVDAALTASGSELLLGDTLAKGSRKSTMNASTAGGSSPGGSFEGGGPQAPIYITPWGTKFHNYLSCPSLRNSRRLRMSPFCRTCAQGPFDGPPFVVYSLGASQTVHYSRNCPDATNCRGYARCGLCRKTWMDSGLSQYDEDQWTTKHVFR